jgi:hypothetical protein
VDDPELDEVEGDDDPELGPEEGAAAGAGDEVEELLVEAEPAPESPDFGSPPPAGEVR